MASAGSVSKVTRFLLMGVTNAQVIACVDLVGL